jgi:hypothetical protein
MMNIRTNENHLVLVSRPEIRFLSVFKIILSTVRNCLFFGVNLWLSVFFVICEEVLDVVFKSFKVSSVPQNPFFWMQRVLPYKKTLKTTEIKTAFDTIANSDSQPGCHKMVPGVLPIITIP